MGWRRRYVYAAWLRVKMAKRNGLLRSAVQFDIAALRREMFYEAGRAWTGN